MQLDGPVKVPHTKGGGAAHQAQFVAEDALVLNVEVHGNCEKTVCGVCEKKGVGGGGACNQDPRTQPTIGSSETLGRAHYRTAIHCYAIPAVHTAFQASSVPNYDVSGVPDACCCLVSLARGHAPGMSSTCEKNMS